MVGFLNARFLCGEVVQFQVTNISQITQLCLRKHIQMLQAMFDFAANATFMKIYSIFLPCKTINNLLCLQNNHFVRDFATLKIFHLNTGSKYKYPGILDLLFPINWQDSVSEKNFGFTSI